jgi:hypothetical protein
MVLIDFGFWILFFGFKGAMPGFSFIPTLAPASHTADNRGYYDYSQALSLPASAVGAINAASMNGHRHAEATGYAITNTLSRDQVLQRSILQPFVGVFMISKIYSKHLTM